MTYVMYVIDNTMWLSLWPINQTNDTESTKLKAEIEKLKTEQTNSNKVIIEVFFANKSKNYFKKQKTISWKFSICCL